MRREAQLLLIDADDTLWENNKYFERAIARYMELLTPSGLQTPEIRARINHEERRTIAEGGYGLRTFKLALSRAYRGLLGLPAELPVAPTVQRRIDELAEEIATEPIEFLPGAEATLAYLAPRHRLVMVTKGDYAEQTRKVELAGMRRFFAAIDVVPEKNAAVYRQQAAAWGGTPRDGWMIGNSPRSDINPARAAGLNAVFIPHPQTWVLEHDEIEAQPGTELLELERFEQLREHF